MFCAVYSLLASQYHDSRAVHETKASELTEKYAKLHSWDELKGVSIVLYNFVIAIEYSLGISKR